MIKSVHLVLLFITTFLFDFYGEVLGEGEAMPLVIDREDVACEGVALLVGHLAEQVAVDSPLEGHGVLGLDEVLVFVAEGNPLAVYLDLCARDVEDNAMIVALIQYCAFILLDGQRLLCRHQVLHEEAGWIDELERLSLSV